MDNINLKISSSPHVRSKDTTSDIMFDVVIALIPATAFGIYLHGWYSALLVAVCILSCVGFEAWYQHGMHKKITAGDFSAVVTGLLLALNLPPKFPIWMAILGSAFAIIVVKQLFGGLGQNFMNPALGARCFLLLAFSRYMTDFYYDSVSTATPLAVLATEHKVNLHNMFFGYTAGTIGETSVIALLIGAAYLLIKKVISPRIPVIYILTFAACTAIYAVVKDYNVALYTAAHICGGGLMLGAWFMATDYVTSPITPKGKVIYAILLGVLTFVLRTFGASAEGVSYAIIISNLLVPLIERVTVPKAFGAGAEAAKPEKSGKKAIVKAIFAIFMITVVMGAALGIVYNITKEPISNANEKAKQESYAAVMNGAEEIKAMSDISYEDINNWLLDEGFKNDTIEEVSVATADGETLGYIVLVTDSAGYGGDIQMAVGVDVSGSVTGISFLSINETAGLGMEAQKDAFKNQFVGKDVEKFSYTKTGAASDSEIDALSGATITTSAVTVGINAAIAYVNSQLGK